MKIIIYDFEVFKYDTLLGAIILDGSSKKYFQSWNLETIKKFYYDNEDSIWIGHNNAQYDNLILEAIIRNKNPYIKSQEIISGKRGYSHLPKYYFDLMQQTKIPYGLKSTEAYVGKNISESEVDFNLDRELTEEERFKTESYNRDDLDQTFDNFSELYPQFELRLAIIKEFGLDLKDLSITGTKIAAKVLHATPIAGIEDMKIKPIIYDTLRLKNKELLNYYLEEKFRTSEKLKIMVGGVEQQIGSGGIHSALEKYHTDRALYFDVSGYYNLIMLNYDLLPRTLPKESKELYEYMYHEQLRLKKIDPMKRGVYKTILLSVFGAMLNKYTDFYDPQKGLLVTITGQLFAVDLMEKLEGIAKVVQSNTDGIIVEPYNWNDKDKVYEIVDEWCDRTGFVIKKEEITDLWQRDVNCYCYKKDGKIEVKGEAVRMFEHWDKMFDGNFFDSKEPAIFAYTTVNMLVNDILPEDTIEKYKKNLRMFQFLCKKKSFDYTELETTDLEIGEISLTRLQGINRAFASNDKTTNSVVYKCKYEGKVKRARVANLPDNVFVFDESITEPKNVEYIMSKIDYNYYIERAYEKLTEFLPDESR